MRFARARACRLNHVRVDSALSQKTSVIGQFASFISKYVDKYAADRFTLVFRIVQSFKRP